MTQRLSVALLFCLAPLCAQPPAADFFEKKIRPVLATRCFSCHASTLKSPMGGLALDSAAGLRRGGADGPVVVAGKPADSMLLRALKYTDPTLQMPPSGKLPDAVIADFDAWIAAGAVDPRVDAPTASAAPAPLKGMSVEDGRKWWAFQPLKESAAPAVKATAWPRTKIDSYLLAAMESKGLKPSPEADARTLITRASINLNGLRPSYEEVEAFARDKSPDAWPRLVDRLLASPRYGEQWARHWLDVARYGEDNSTAEATNPGFPFAWRYRDWVIEALNKDVPYDRFIKLQLAADQTPGATREDLRALGYLGAAPVYHKDLRLSAEVIGGFLTDDWDERVDALSRGLLAMTVACARCHDHKFDPIPTKDYYGLVGVFASTMRAERPLFDVDPKTEQRYMWLQNRLFDLYYSANLLITEESTVIGAADRVVKWRAEMEELRAESNALAVRYPQLAASLSRHFKLPPERRGPRPAASTAPFVNAVFDAAQVIDGADPQFTWIHYKPGEARDHPVLLHGNVATPGDIVPRHFPTVLAKSDPNFREGSGRRELADRIFTDSSALAARVIVNRVWGWHFGRSLAITASDFGVQGEKPSNPALLEDLSARFIAHGWSLKWLHREIMLSAAYRQSSRVRPEAAAIDQQNTYLWRMNPRRLEFEPYRDSLLRASGRLSAELYGPSDEVTEKTNTRRTIYARVSRTRLSDLLRIYDLPDPMQTAAERDVTTTSLQQLFVMNSDFLHDRAAELGAAVSPLPDAAAKARALYRRILSRDPRPEELDRAVTFLSRDTAAAYAQILLSLNEVIFWP